MAALEDYDYHLPPELVAQEPLAERTSARLLVVQRARGHLEHAHIRDLPRWLQPGDCLVLNETKVVPARLTGVREQTGGRWEGLFLEATQDRQWKVLAKTRGKPQPGETIRLHDRMGVDRWGIELIANLGGGVWLARPLTSGDPFDLLGDVGQVPLPHYIRGGRMEDADFERYQTVYARKPGAVAAPTAGLHFTRELLEQLERVGIDVVRVTLHVGMGTFRPISTPKVADHEMHAEWGHLDANVARQLNARREAGGRVIAVGTTSVRVLETAAGDDRQFNPWEGETRLFIHPPYTFRGVDGLLTNFHLPRTSLLVLVRTLGGDELVRRAYETAVQERYRFYSYGDAMLIL